MVVNGVAVGHLFFVGIDKDVFLYVVYDAVVP
jgi:hypothetical protein